MKLRIVPALAGRGAIVLLGFRPIALTAIQLDKIGMRLRQRRIARERRFVRVDGAPDVSAFSQAHAPGQVARASSRSEVTAASTGSSSRGQRAP